MSNESHVDRRKALAEKILPLAREVLTQHRDRTLSDEALRGHIRSLMTGLDPKHAVTSVLGALASAVIELDEKLSAGAIDQGRSPEELTRQLFRLAYNRWQNEHRREVRLQRASGLAMGSVPDEGDPKTRLDEMVSRKSQPSPESDARIRELNDYMMRTLDARDIVIWVMYAEGHSKEAIAEAIHRHRTTVLRKLQRFSEIVERFLERSDEDPEA